MKNDRLLKFTELEINGYKQETKVPAYPQTIAHLNFVLSNGNQNEVIELLIETLEAQLNTQLRNIQIREGMDTSNLAHHSG